MATAHGFALGALIVYGRVFDLVSVKLSTGDFHPVRLLFLFGGKEEVKKSLHHVGHVAPTCSFAVFTPGVRFEVD